MAGGDRGDRCAAISLIVALRALDELALVTPDARRRLLAALRVDDEAWLARCAVVGADRASAFFVIVDDLVGDDRRDAFAARWCALHPTLRGVAALAATPLGWLDLCWRAIDALHPFATHRFRCDGDTLALRVRPASTATSATLSAWCRLMHAVAQHAPAMIGAATLRSVRAVIDGDGLGARYAMTSTSSAAARVARVTGVPLRSVLATLAALPRDAVDGGAGNDGDDTQHDGQRFALDDNDASGAFAAFARRHALTRGEARVLARLANGLTPVEVARALHIALGTVRVHLKHVYRKTGARGQRALLSLVDGARPT